MIVNSSERRIEFREKNFMGSIVREKFPAWGAEKKSVCSPGSPQEQNETQSVEKNQSQARRVAAVTLAR
jgi:hypothetical protein